MASKSYCYQFSDQKVFASENAPLSFQIVENYAIVAMNNYTVGVYDISYSNFTLINLFSVCGCVIKIDYCIFDDYIITLESKDHADIKSIMNNSVRTYHNWRNGGTQSKTRFRPALGLKLSNVPPSHVANTDKSNSMGESPYLENVVDVLEFLHLSHPLSFSIYTNSNSIDSVNSKFPNQNYEDIYSHVAISENTYVHIYRFYAQHRRSRSSSTSLTSRQSATKLNENDTSASENSFYFQHLYTVKFSFMSLNVSLLSRVLVVSSLDKVQVIQILEEKQKSDMFSITLERKAVSNISSQIELDIDKCWLTSISNARKSAAAKPKLRPKEILGPTQNLDTASITLLRYADSKEMSFETLLFRKYLNTTPSSLIQNIHLVRVPEFDKLGLFVVLKTEIVHYSFCLKTNEIIKIAEYDFQNESLLSMTFSENTNLIHVAFSNGDLVTYNSRLCAADLFESNDVSKRVSLTRLGKVTLMGLTDVRSSGPFICVCCKFNVTEEAELENAVLVSPDSWNFYLFSQPQKSDLKNGIIAHAEHKGNKKLLQMLFCSLLVFPSKKEVNIKMIEDIIICCLKSEKFYVELVPHLLLRNGLAIVDVLNILQILETKELYDDQLFQIYAKEKLINADFTGLNEDHFRWILIKILQCSINLLFEVMTTNSLEDFLKADLLIIEGLDSTDFESIFIKILYFSAHGDYDLVQPLLAYLDQKAVKKLIKSQPHLIFHNKRHTSFGWALNLYDPQIYASIVVSCFLNHNDNHELTNLEIGKKVGQCSHIMVLEEFLRKTLKECGLIPNTRKYCQNKLKNSRRESFYLTMINHTQSVANNESYTNYINQLLILYHEFSFNAVEFCPHKSNPLCRKIPSWLKALRYHDILDQFHPFNGISPFGFPHVEHMCISACCQSYLIRLQCLLSWKESWKLPGKNVIEASCESMSHPAWKSLHFLLLQQAPVENRNIPNIITFINSSDKPRDQNIIDLYFSNFGCEISIGNWKEIIESQRNAIPLTKMLKYASSTQNVRDFHQMLDKLKEAEVIEMKEYKEWAERSGKLCHRTELFNSLLKKIIEESA